MGAGGGHKALPMASGSRKLCSVGKAGQGGGWETTTETEVISRARAELGKNKIDSKQETALSGT